MLVLTSVRIVKFARRVVVNINDIEYIHRPNDYTYDMLIALCLSWKAVVTVYPLTEPQLVFQASKPRRVFRPVSSKVCRAVLPSLKHLNSEG